MLEAIDLAEKVTGRTLDWDYEETPRIGDHRLVYFGQRTVSGGLSFLVAVVDP